MKADIKLKHREKKFNKADFAKAYNTSEKTI